MRTTDHDRPVIIIDLLHLRCLFLLISSTPAPTTIPPLSCGNGDQLQLISSPPRLL